MNLYLISQTENSDYDTYDSAVVCALNEVAAGNTSPWDGEQISNEDWERMKEGYWGWCHTRGAVKVKYLGVADVTIPAGVVCASYNAG